MSGTIGLTPAGQMLDFIMTDLDANDRRLITKFIGRVTRIAKQLRDSLPDNNNKNTILTIVRNHYIDEINNTFEHIGEIYGSNMGDMVTSLITSYTTAIFKKTFVPDTRTQKALERKRIAAGTTN